MSEGSMQHIIQEALADADDAFIRGSVARMELGEDKYGPLKFLEVDTVEEAMNEALDLANYARFIYIKLFLLQRATNRLATRDPRTDTQGFISFKEMFEQ
jgi:hypothetical protein